MDTQTLPSTHQGSFDSADLPSRLRDARESKGLSRAKLSSETGIPAKSIEKFEAGDQEPSVSRLLTLANALGVSFDALIGRNVDETVEEVPENSPETSDLIPEVELQPTPLSDASMFLEQLDRLRGNSFEGSPRFTAAVIDKLKGVLDFLEPGQLMVLADQRELFKEDCPSASGLLDMLLGDFQVGNAECSIIEERIIDTAVFGVDLFGIQLDALEDLADQLEISHPSGFFTAYWENHSEILDVLRPPLRALAITGNVPDLENEEQFPLRGT